jgi:putative ABC transport system permease protein
MQSAAICTVVLQLQLDYLRNRRLGFEQDYVITYPAHYLGDKYPAFKQTLLQYPNILAASSGLAAGTGQINMSTKLTSPVSGKTFGLYILRVDYGYFETFGLEFKAGRSFSRESPADQKSGVILNETAARLLGIDEAPVGKIFESDNKRWQVVGVVEDYNHHPLRIPVKAMAYLLGPGHNWNGLVRLHPQSFGRKRGQRHRATNKGFRQAGAAGECHGFAGRMARDEHAPAELRLSHRDFMVGVCVGRWPGSGDCAFDGEHTGD